MNFLLRSDFFQTPLSQKNLNILSFFCGYQRFNFLLPFTFSLAFSDCFSRFISAIRYYPAYRPSAFLTGQQRKFHNDIKLFMMIQLAREFLGTAHSVFKSVNGDHGRIEERNVWMSTEVEWLIERHPRWKSIKGIAVVDSSRTVIE